MIQFISLKEALRLSADAGLIIFAVRSLPKDSKGQPVMPPFRCHSIHLPDLSPSEDLFHWYLEQRKLGNWYPDSPAWEQYKARFLQEMQSDAAIRWLSRLYGQGRHTNIYFVCYCDDERTCHRSLVREILSWKSPDQFSIIVAGSRGFNDYSLLEYKLDRLLWNYRGNVRVIEGEARGADTLAKRYAIERGYELVKMPADWNRYGKSAGYHRNEEMFRYLVQTEPNPERRGCVCFWDGQSRGTQHNFGLAEQYNVRLAKVIYKLP